ncbi:MAG: hypothetical protein HY259_15095 [Chloroflexi bacterium]|nr:hypothetical protein [Chloroflexota bacterium]
MPANFNSRTHYSQTLKRLSGGAIALVLMVGLTFVAFRYGQTALFVAIGVFGTVGAMIICVWLALKVIDLVAGKDES